MPPVGFEPTILAGERPHTYPLYRAATWNGTVSGVPNKIIALFVQYSIKSTNVFRGPHNTTWRSACLLGRQTGTPSLEGLRSIQD